VLFMMVSSCHITTSFASGDQNHEQFSKGVSTQASGIKNRVEGGKGPSPKKCITCTACARKYQNYLQISIQGFQDIKFSQQTISIACYFWLRVGERMLTI
jgi:hypothetical protein